MNADQERAFVRFVKETEPKLSYALAAAYGPEIGSEATSEALVYVWEHWPKIRAMGNPAGYLYRVGQSKSRRFFRPKVAVPGSGREEMSSVSNRSYRQLWSPSPRTSAWRSCSCTPSDGPSVKRRSLMGVSRATVRTHVERALARLRAAMEVQVDV